LKVGELIRLLEDDGWRLARTRGSHRQYKHASKSGTVTVAGKPSLDVPPGTLNAILKQAGLEGEELEMAMVRRMVVVEHGETGWGAHAPGPPGCVAVGETRQEVLQLIREAIELHIESLKPDGLPVPPPSSAGEVVEVGAA
jgi:predicted RNA binding protein YcfA (HicA-like mRNA interferase family)/predicted RNase H-like HicB family nuclease